MDIFIARQPIFDRDRNVTAYELLFRNGLRNAFESTDGTDATRQVIVHGFLHFGMPMLTAGKRAFINVNREVLVQEYIHLFPANSVVAEILENVDPDEITLGACQRLRRSGYAIALDDFARVGGYEALLELADFVKIDFRATQGEERRRLGAEIRQANPSLQLLAEKVETYEEFEQSLGEGFTLFQGYFFAKPEMLSKKEIPGNRLQYLRLLHELNRPDIDLQKLENLIRLDMSMSYRLLRYINSAFFGWRTEVRSLRHALALLGERDIRKWASLVALSYLAEEKPLEVLVTGLTRARFLELLGQQTGVPLEADHLFLIGVFSVLDAILDKPLVQALSGLAIPTDVQAALLGKPGPKRDLFDLALALEQADWTRLSALCSSLKIAEPKIPSMYAEAVGWAEMSFTAPIDSVRPRPHGGA